MKADISRWVVGRACLLLAALLLAGCSPPPAGADFLAYQTKSSRAELSGELNGVEFSALVELSPLPEDGSAREFRLEYTAPDELRGIVLMSREGVTTLSFEGLELPGGVFSDLCKPADAFALSADVISAEAKKSEDGTALTQLVLSDGSSVTVDSESGYPVGITTSGLTLRVVWFEPEERK